MNIDVQAEAPATLILKSQADRRIKKGHLWIYSNEVDIARSPLKALSTGSLVAVHSASGKPLGQAFVNPNALICGRLLSRDADEAIDRRFLKRRLQQALALRAQCFPEPYYRLVYGDADFLPGIVIDRYGDYLVVQIAVAGFDRMQDELLGVLDELVQPRGIVLRNNHQARELEQLSEQIVTHGDVPDLIPVMENQCRFEISATQGQKTGWFYDHRMNRAVLQGCAKGKRVLDVFAYLGGWGVEAAFAGASEVVCVDSSQSAVDGVMHNASLNGLSGRVQAIRGKALDVLKELCDSKDRFDVVVLDPPAFIKRRKDQKAGEAAYRHINELAIRLLEKDGLLVSASCSMPLAADALTDIVRGAARHCDRDAQLIYRGSQGPDHPVHPAIPETDYLKAQFFRITPAH